MIKHEDYLEHANFRNFLKWRLSRMMVFLSLIGMLIASLIMVFASDIMIKLCVMLPLNLFFFYMILKHIKAFMFTEKEVDTFGLKGIEDF